MEIASSGYRPPRNDGGQLKNARFHFDAEFRPLLPYDKRLDGFDLSFRGPQSVKHLIESLGVPHTEIGPLTANGESIGLDYIVHDGDQIEVRPVASEICPTEPRFVLDGHLGRLNSHLRMLGLDCFYENHYDDDTLFRLSVDENRILLTRDRRLLMRKLMTQGYLVRSLDPAQQFHETVRRYGLQKWVRPFQRCIHCNHLLEPVAKEIILDRLEPLTKLYFDDFRICPACQQIYWKGSHFEKMQRLIADLDAGPAQP